MEQKLGELLTWLQENKITIQMAFETPTGEQIRLENFIPKELRALGWKPILNLVPIPEKSEQKQQ
jgi:hypothetical protein